MIVRVNADFTRRATVSAEDYRWIQSPQAGVDRVLLDRVGGESARATSVVRYAPGSIFPMHHHPGGEEILVLSGSLSDEQGCYPAGFYLRNPPGSSHSPFSPDGAQIFVKLWQMSQDDKTSVRIDTQRPESWSQVVDRDVCNLYESCRESVKLIRLRSGSQLFERGVDSAEVFILRGCMLEGDRRYLAGSWLRLPQTANVELTAAEEGCVVYVKLSKLMRVLCLEDFGL